MRFSLPALLAACLAASPLYSAETEAFRISTVTAAEKTAVRALDGQKEDYGNFVVVRASGARADSIRRASGLQVEALAFTIGLRDYQFDPQRAHPAQDEVRRSGRLEATSGRNYHLLQFNGPVRESWQKELATMGIEFVQYVPNFAYIVYADTAAMGAAKAHPQVRWTGTFDPLFRVASELAWVYDTSVPSDRRTTATNDLYYVAVFKRAPGKEVAAEIAKYGEVVHRDIHPEASVFDLLRVRLRPEQLAKVAALDHVYAVEPYVAKSLEDERGAQVLAGNYTGTAIGNLNAPPYNPLTQFGSDGTNVSVGVVDSGLEIPGPSGYYITASRAVSGPLRGAAPPSYQGGHGHFCASLIGGSTPFPPGILDPLGYNYGRGVAPGVNFVSIPYITDGYSGGDADVANDMMVTLPPNGIRPTISNNSWGAGAGVSYTALEAAYDGFVRDASQGPTIDSMLYVFSSGNAGPGAQTMTRPKAAKNVLTVGSSVGLRPELPGFQGVPNTNLDYMANYSSRGPAQDTRIKPDVVAPGQQTSGPKTTSNADGFSLIDTIHAYGSGTSFAAPHASGGAALFTGWWKANNGGAVPSPALIKAALINGTVEMNAEFAGVPGSSSTAVIPNSAEGWGRLNLSRSVNPSVTTRYVDQSVAFTSLSDSYTFNGTSVSGSAPLRVTLVWTDVPGAAGANPAQVNDLDLIVTVGANVYRGNVFASGASTTGGSGDRRNNVENVFLPSIPAGTNFTVQVVPIALNGNGILGTAGNNQHFGLVISNANVSGCPNFTVDPATIPGSIARGAVYPTQTFTATGGAAPITYSIAGTLPPGLTLNGNQLSGTPTTAGTYPFSVLATDANGCFGSRAYSILVTGPIVTRGAATVTTGNAVIEPSECNMLNVVLNNSGTGVATSVQAVLSTSTPGATVVSAISAYNNLAANNGTGTNTTPFAISTDGSIPCYTMVALTLTVTYAEGGPEVFNFSLPVGIPGGPYTIVRNGTSANPLGTLLPGSQADDAALAFTVPAGFNFSVYDHAVIGGSTITISTNGNVQFSPTGTNAAVNAALPVSSTLGGVGVFPANAPTVFVYWDDLDLRITANGGTNNGIYTDLSGTAPNRILTIRWRGALQTGTPVNFGIQFKEGTPNFDCVYNNSAGANGASATVGVQAASSGTRFTQFSFDTGGTFNLGTRLTATVPIDICTPGGGGCALPPVFSSAIPSGPVIVGTAFTHTFTASGAPAPTFALTAGTLPPGLTLTPAGVLGGTATLPADASYPNITVTASNGNLPNATQTFTLPVVTRAANYIASFGLTGRPSQPDADPDGDGLGNKAEYGFNLNPTAGNANPVEHTVRNYSGTNYLSVRFPRSIMATDLTYIVEVAADLGATPIVWTELARSTAGAVTSGPGFVSETGTGQLRTVEVRDTVVVPTPGQPQRFIRVRLE